MEDKFQEQDKNYTNKVYRTEWKYLITSKEIELLENKLKNIIKLDPNTPKEGKYVIHSLYFDDYNDTSVKTTSDRNFNRFKWRIRYYDENLDYIILEKKEKKEGKGHKKSCKLTIEEYNKIVSEEIEDLIYDTKKALIRELTLDMMTKKYKPKVIIDYERIAYVEDVTNVRITFDKNLSASYEVEEFLSREYQNFYLLPQNLHILEVKFDEILPSYVKNIVEAYTFKRTSFSKYLNGRKLMNNYII